MIRKRLHLFKAQVIEFRMRLRLEWQETKHMSRVYRDVVLRRAPREEIDRAHAQAGDMLRILILGSTQVIPLPILPTLLVLGILKTGKTLGIRVVPSSWHEAHPREERSD